MKWNIVLIVLSGFLIIYSVYCTVQQKKLKRKYERARLGDILYTITENLCLSTSKLVELYEEYISLRGNTGKFRRVLINFFSSHLKVSQSWKDCIRCFYEIKHFADTNEETKSIIKIVFNRESQKIISLYTTEIKRIAAISHWDTKKKQEEYRNVQDQGALFGEYQVNFPLPHSVIEK